MKIALVHDFLAQDGGAEKILSAFQEVWPQAPTHLLFYDRDHINPEFFNHPIKTSFLQKMPGGISKYQWYLPLMPFATEQHNLGDFDVVLSSSSLFAKGVITNPKTLHLCYCHTPPRFLWNEMHQYIEDLKYNRLVKKIIPFVLKSLRQWDLMAASRVDHFIANSQTVKARIDKYYRRPSDVIYPPVKTKNFYISPKIENYFLAGGRLVGYKKFDIIVQAFNRLGMPLKIFGAGPMMEKLKKIAKKNVEFLGQITEQEKSKLFAECLAFINPQIEDFGITAIEAMASGRPVIAYGQGGAQETIVPDKTGEFMDEQSWEELGNRVIRFAPENYNPALIRSHAQQFDEERFKNLIRDYVYLKWREFGERKGLV